MLDFSPSGAGGAGVSPPKPCPAGHVCYHDRVRINVLFFGLLKDLTGRGEDAAEFPQGTTMEEIWDYYASRYPKLAPMRGSILMARNQEFASAASAAAEGDEIAFLPPVSGGSGGYTREVADAEGHFFALTRDPVNVSAITGRLLQGKDGAVVVFEGVVRDNTRGRPTLYLDYECYEAMAVKVMARIGREIAGSHAISRIALVHRLGRMEIGETSVAVVTCAPHRGPAFQAALEGINRLKKTVPIWKKEHFADGEVWVDGEWDDSLRGH